MNNNQENIQEIEDDNNQPQEIQIEGMRYNLPSPPLLVRQYGMINNEQPNNNNKGEPEELVRQLNNFRL